MYIHCTRFSFLRNHFSPKKNLQTYDILFMLHFIRSPPKMKSTKIVNIFQLLVYLPLYFFFPLVKYNPYSSRYIYILVRLLFLSLQCINTSLLPEPEMNWGSIEDKAISDSIYKSKYFDIKKRILYSKLMGNKLS